MLERHVSSPTGWRKADGQRLGPLLGALSGPFTPFLHLCTRHPSPPMRRVLDVVVQVAGAHRGSAVATRDLTAGGVPARLYTPDGVAPGGGLLVYFHGGGFVVCSLDSHAQVCRFIARRTGCKVLAVGYRKAPEHPFPAAVDDCTAAFRWAVANAPELGVDPNRVAVGGDSAGGNAAVVVCLDTAGDQVRPCGAWLLYPVVDAAFGAWPSDRLFARGPLLSSACLRDMFARYADPSRMGDARLSVLRSTALGGLPPMYLATAGMDPLRDQGEDFARRARAAGATVEVRRFERLPHAFINLLIDRSAATAAGECVDALAGLLGVANGASRG
jgi:acetyl esterase/lipase